MSTFLQACRGEPVDTVPVWFMRQAGRSLPGYRELRKKYGLLELTRNPELATQVSLEPVERLGVDAAILFADIMLLPIAMGVEVEMVEHVGPVIAAPIRAAEDVDRLRVFEPESVSYLQNTIRLLKARTSVPIIGFSGGPFTLASYLIEGKPTRDWLKTKQFMLETPELWNALMKELSHGVVGYLEAQIDAGADVVQIFDSWVGCLSPQQYRDQVLPHMHTIFSALKKDNVPRIHFGTSTAGILSDFANVDCEVVGIDWRIDAAEAKKYIGKKTLQGNLDPALLLAPWPVIEYAVDTLFDSINPKQSYIFNLGHGMPATADDAVVRKLVEYIHGK